MPVKSSEVLRLAAELEFKGIVACRKVAARRMKSKIADRLRQDKYCELVKWVLTPSCTEHAVRALCLAAAIAESEGD